jgi:hypothetical protein
MNRASDESEKNGEPLSGLITVDLRENRNGVPLRLAGQYGGSSVSCSTMGRSDKIGRKETRFPSGNLFL